MRKMDPERFNRTELLKYSFRNSILILNNRLVLNYQIMKLIQRPGNMEQ